MARIAALETIGGKCVPRPPSPCRARFGLTGRLHCKYPRVCPHVSARVVIHTYCPLWLRVGHSPRLGLFAPSGLLPSPPVTRSAGAFAWLNPARVAPLWNEHRSGSDGRSHGFGNPIELAPNAVESSYLDTRNSALRDLFVLGIVRTARLRTRIWGQLERVPTTRRSGE